ncbi:MAG: hypothetical protein J0L84_08700 [Verrucomicrobia bacterium]|nr:hypothetical protein [Verrucomicrobiota bacterium]
MRDSFHRFPGLGFWLALLLAGSATGCSSYRGYQPETLTPPDHREPPTTTRPDTSSPPGYPGSR